MTGFESVWKNQPEEEFPRNEIEKWVGNSELARDALRLEFFANVPFLKNAYIVDTPGTRAIIEDHEEKIQEFITDKTESETHEQGNRADAIIYVFPPVARETDEELLRSFEQGSRIQNAAPYNSVTVVHKWETINSPDPFEEVQRKVAQIKKVFNAYVAEVLPVSAPMGWACEHFDDDFWETIFSLGSLSAEVIKGLLLTDKRFFTEIVEHVIVVEQTSKTRAFFTNRFLHEMHPLSKTVGPVGDEQHFCLWGHRQHRKVTAQHFKNFFDVFHRAVEKRWNRSVGLTMLAEKINAKQFRFPPFGEISRAIFFVFG